jgi:hypothetical protein
MQRLMRFVCIVYLVLLTFLLLTADPLRLVGVHGTAPGWLRAIMPAAHILSFWVLTMLTLLTHWPAPRWGITVFLVVYAGMTEVTQSFFPPRTAEWLDWLQDLAGIAIGAILCWTLSALVGTMVRCRHATEVYDAPSVSDDWNVLRCVMSRPATRGQSWWN